MSHWSNYGSSSWNEFQNTYDRVTWVIQLPSHSNGYESWIWKGPPKLYGKFTWDHSTSNAQMIGDVGEMFGLYYDFMERPYCTYQIFSKEGVLMKPVPITIPKGVMIHDFAITENYAIFLDLSLLINPKVCIYKPTRTILDILVKTSKMPN